MPLDIGIHLPVSEATSMLTGRGVTKFGLWLFKCRSASKAGKIWLNAGRDRVVVKGKTLCGCKHTTTLVS